MPVIETSSYDCKGFSRSSHWGLNRRGHWQTIYPTLFRKLPKPDYQRETILTADQDFLDLDWCKNGSRRLVILTHGLEGHSNAIYMRGMVRALTLNGWDTLSWNMRGCSGRPNATIKAYHSGATEDLLAVFTHALFKKDYEEISLIGFSLGGNLTLKFLGEHHESMSSLITKAVVISVPCDLQSSARKLAILKNRIYQRRFLKTLKAKALAKATQFPGKLDPKKLKRLKNIEAFDEAYTAPIHGFKSAADYYESCSSSKYLSEISVPTLLVNALDDPFLTPACFPYEAAQKNPCLFLETPKHGGHVGFFRGAKSNLFWSEQRTMEFLDDASIAPQIDRPQTGATAADLEIQVLQGSGRNNPQLTEKNRSAELHPVETSL